MPTFFIRILALFFSVPILVTLILIVVVNYVAPRRSLGLEVEMEHWVVDESGAVLSSNTSQPVPVDAQDLALSQNGLRLRSNRGVNYKLASVVPLLGTPKRFLVTRQSISWARTLWSGLGSITLFSFLCVIVGAIFSNFLVKRETNLAASVLKAIRQGDLQARFPSSSRLRLGGLVELFNEMAEEISCLVGRLKASESARAETLQELAHDVRTPLSGMRLLIWSLIQDSSAPQRGSASKKLSLLDEEVGYLQRLIDSLLTLAQIEDPAFADSREIVDMAAVLRNEFEICREMDDSGRLWKLSVDPLGSHTVRASSAVLSRVIRNLIDNAARHGTKFVEASVSSKDGVVVVIVLNDGHISRDGIANFGRRRDVRLVRVESGARGSVGLGSVIVKKVAEKLSGEVVVNNWNEGERSGVLVMLSLPRVEDSSLAPVQEYA